MALELIEGFSGKWQPKKYKDTYTAALKKVIKAKQAGKEIHRAPEAEPEEQPDLFEALRESVRQQRGSKPPKRARLAQTATARSSASRARSSRRRRRSSASTAARRCRRTSWRRRSRRPPTAAADWRGMDPSPSSSPRCRRRPRACSRSAAGGRACAGARRGRVRRRRRRPARAGRADLPPDDARGARRHRPVRGGGRALSLHHIDARRRRRPDRGAARPRGKLVVEEFGWDRVDQPTAAWIAEQRGDSPESGARGVATTSTPACIARRPAARARPPLRGALLEWQPYLPRSLERPELEPRERAAIDRGEIPAIGFR